MSLSEKEIEAVKEILNYLAGLFLPPVIAGKTIDKLVDKAVERFVNHPMAGVILYHIYMTLKRCYEEGSKP